MKTKNTFNNEQTIKYDVTCCLVPNKSQIDKFTQFSNIKPIEISKLNENC